MNVSIVSMYLGKSIVSSCFRVIHLGELGGNCEQEMGKAGNFAFMGNGKGQVVKKC
jgi:hypothetical protein